MPNTTPEICTNAQEMQKAKPWTPYQYGIVGLLLTAMIIGYMDRVNFSVVIPVLIKEYQLSPTLAGVLLSTFNWALAVAFLFSGPLTDRFHAYRVLPAGITLWSFATIMAGLSASVPILGAARALLGIGESTLLPSGSKLISEIFPKNQQGKAIGIYLSGSKIGLAIGAPLAALLLSAYSWHAVFFVTGAVSLLWLIPWFLIYRKGKEVIPESLTAMQSTQAVQKKVQWRELFTYKETWVLMLGQGGYLYVYFIFLTWLPSYLVMERGMSILKTGIFATFPFLIAVFVGIFSGWLSDRWLQAGGSLSKVRKTFIGGGFILSFLFIVAGVNLEAEVPALFCLFMSMGILGMVTPNINALPIDLASREVVSSVTALQNFGGNIGGAIAPIVTGILLAKTGSFQIALYVAGAVALCIGAGVHIFLLDKIEPRIGIDKR